MRWSSTRSADLNDSPQHAQRYPSLAFIASRSASEQALPPPSNGDLSPGKTTAMDPNDDFRRLKFCCHNPESCD